MALRYFTLSSSLCAETIGGAWEVRLEKNMERVRAMVSISFYLYEVGSARAPKGFPWWTAGMKIDPRVPNTLIRKDYSIVNFTNIYSVSTQIRYLSKPQKWYSKFKSANYECEQRTNKARAAYEQRANSVRTTRELRANSVRELVRTTRELRARTHPRTTRRARLVCAESREEE